MVSAGRVDEAFQHYSGACVLRPNYALCHYNRAEILFTRYQLRAALEQYTLAESLTDSKEMALSCLVNSDKILVNSGDYDSAEIEFARRCRSSQ